MPSPQLEQTILAYYLANGAQDLTMVPRYWPLGELVLIVEDKIKFATYQFGARVAAACPAVARTLVDQLMERGGFSTVDNNFGGTMHQFQPEAYRDCVTALRAENSILGDAEANGPDYWDRASSPN